MLYGAYYSKHYQDRHSVGPSCLPCLSLTQVPVVSTLAPQNSVGKAILGFLLREAF